MLVSVNWLSQYVDISDIRPEDLAEKITRTGIEVESVNLISSAKGVVIGHVLECRQHPNADKLSLCQVDLGGHDGVVQIVCGAKNVAAGQKVIVAQNGAILPGNFKIKKSKLRGEESNGMICSLQELGIEQKLVPSKYVDGIFVCSELAPIGMDALEYLQFNDTVIELGLTPNRMDCLSMYGVAYEVGAILARQVTFKEIKIKEVAAAAKDLIKITIQTQKSSAYLARVIKNVKIKESPQWLQTTLIAAGMRPKNNVVDITNYVMLETGQPLHAFDYDTILSKEIVVREAVNGEKIKTLDGQDRQLVQGDVIITDGQKPIAIAGVMGGFETEVTDETKTILLESAIFDPLSVRKSATRLSLRSEASARFEKGIDPERVEVALNRAAELLGELAKGDITSGIVLQKGESPKPFHLALTVNKINQVLGTTITNEELAAIWERLQFKYELNQGVFTVYIPSRRLDITIVEDLIEEAGRLYGYDRIPVTLPSTATKGGYHKRQELRNKAHVVLQACGLTQVVTYSLTSAEKATQFLSVPTEKSELVKLSMPMSEERSYLRQSIIPQLLEVIGYNKARTQMNVAIYEIGKVYGQVKGNYLEETKIAGAVMGELVTSKWQKKVEIIDFFRAKGYVETLLTKIGHLNVSYLPTEPKQYPEFHPGRSAVILVNDEVVGVVGQVHPKLQKQADINETYVFQLSLDRIFNLTPTKSSYQPVSKHPGMSRDIALVVSREVPASELVKTIKEVAPKLLQTVTVFDVYEGSGVESGKKSIAISLSYLNPEKTLTDEELQPVHQKVLEALTKEHQAVLRG